MSFIDLDGEAIGVRIAAHYGARVVSLVDKRSGREWMTQGGESPNTGEDAVYLGAEAVGWDECFPTVSKWDGSRTTWGRQLRDHGDLWGRPWQIDSQTNDAASLSFATGQFRFTRQLRLTGDGLAATYAVENLSGQPLPYLWALHGLLAARPGDRIELPAVATVDAVYLSLKGEQKPAARLNWAGANGVLPFSLDVAQPAETVFAGKFYATNLAGGAARIGRPGQWLEIGWDKSIEDLGIWITYGAWPKAGGHYEVALEPTSSPSDHAGQAIDNGYAPLEPGARRSWTVTMRFAA